MYVYGFVICAKHSLLLLQMYRQLGLILGQKRALPAGFFVVNFGDVRRQSFGARRFVVAQSTHERFQMRVEMSFQTPIIHSRPGTVAAGVSLLAFLL